jgi:hypothetical protein
MPMGWVDHRSKGMMRALRNGRMGMSPPSRSADAVRRTAMATARIECRLAAILAAVALFYRSGVQRTL